MIFCRVHLASVLHCSLLFLLGHKRQAQQKQGAPHHLSPFLPVQTFQNV
jgi:hypothetical protein